MNHLRAIIAIVLSTAFSVAAFAQQPAAPPPPTPLYTGGFGGGFVVTNGNTNTKNFNLNFDVVRDPKTRNVIKATALYLRGGQNGIVNLERSAFKARDEFKISDRTFAFGQLDYQRDKFKDLGYLLAPGGGLGVKLIQRDPTELAIDGGAGGIWEKDTNQALKKSGMITAGQRFRQKLSANAAFTESLSTLWKTNDFSDSLTNFSLGLTSSVAKHFEIKVEFLDSYKNKPPTASIKKKDTAFVTAFVLKF